MNHEQQMAQLRGQVVSAKSRAFEMVSEITQERDQARTAADNFQQALNRVATALGLKDQVTTDQIVQVIEELKADKKSGKKPSSTKKGAK